LINQSDLVKYFTTSHTKTEKLVNDICHYDLFGQIVCLKVAISKQKLFCFSAALDTLHEDLHIFYVSWLHKFATKPLLCNTLFAYSCQLQVAQQHTQNAVLFFHCNNGYTNAPHFYILHTLLILF